MEAFFGGQICSRKQSKNAPQRCRPCRLPPFFAASAPALPRPLKTAMPASLQDQLVVAISSRALFNFEEENRLFETGDAAAYMQLQLDRLDAPARPIEFCIKHIASSISLKGESGEIFYFGMLILTHFISIHLIAKFRLNFKICRL